VDDRVFLDLQSGEELSELNIFANFIEFNDSQFINNDKWFLTGSPKSKIYLWQVASGNLLAEYGAVAKGQRSSILAVGFDEGVQRITTQNSSGVLEVWPYQWQNKKD
jgi:WD40 repeat protein